MCLTRSPSRVHESRLSAEGPAWEQKGGCETHDPSGSKNTLDTFVSLGEPDLLINRSSGEAELLREKRESREQRGKALPPGCVEDESSRASWINE